MGKPRRPALLAAAGLTVMPDWVPLSELLAVSVAVIDCVPAVFERGREGVRAVVGACSRW